MAENEQILFAEGDARVRTAFGLLFLEEGHNVTLASTHDEVIKIVDNPEAQFRLALVSGSLPDPKDVPNAAKYIKEQRPEVTVISFSAHQKFGDLHISKHDDPLNILATIKSL